MARKSSTWPLTTAGYLGQTSEPGKKAKVLVFYCANNVRGVRMRRLRDVLVASVAALALYFTPACSAVRQHVIKFGNDHSCIMRYENNDSDVIELYDNGNLVALRHHSTVNGKHRALYEFFGGIEKISEYDTETDTLTPTSKKHNRIFVRSKSAKIHREMMRCEKLLEEKLK